MFHKNNEIKFRGGSRWLGWLSFFCLAVLFVFLRWNSFNAPLTRDEGEYAYTAQLLRLA